MCVQKYYKFCNLFFHVIQSHWKKILKLNLPYTEISIFTLYVRTTGVEKEDKRHGRLFTRADLGRI